MAGKCFLHLGNLASTFWAEWREWTARELHSKYRPSGPSCDWAGDMAFFPGEPWEVNSGSEERKQVKGAHAGPVQAC